MITFKKSSPTPRAAAPLLGEGNGKTILLTGAENSLARTLAFGLQELGHMVTAQAFNPEAYLQLQSSLSVITHTLADPRFGEALDALVPDVVIHASAEATADQTARRPLAVFNRVIDKTVALCEAVRLHAPDAHVILLSSSEVYGDCPEPARETDQPSPVSRDGNYFGIAEELARDFAAAHALDLTIARLFSTYGPGVKHNPVADLVVHLLAPASVREPFRLPGVARRDLLHSGDALQAVQHLICARATGVFNLASGQALSLDELAAHVCAILEKPLPTFAEQTPEGAVRNERANIEKLKALGFAPQIPLIESLRGYIAWWSGVKAA